MKQKINKINAFFSPTYCVKKDDADIPIPKKTKIEPRDFSTILQRDSIVQEITNILKSFESQRNNVSFKKGIYIYGSPGSGKTHFITELLKKLDYDVIKYDAGDVRNRSLIDTITSNNISNRNVLHMMNRTEKKIAIVMDEIDGMNNGDKGGINALIKMIRQKKTKKQRLENVTLNPIICIGNYYMDKKIKELIKVCNVFELKTPTRDQSIQIFDSIITHHDITVDLKSLIIDYIQGDLRKLMFIQNMYLKKPEIVTYDTISTILQIKSYNEDSKKITQALIHSPHHIDRHNSFINETDRTIVALLWHENIADPINKKPANIGFPFYLKILDNICFADYIDRITFQHQIWLFNEMSSLIKTFYNNKLYHDTFPENRTSYSVPEIRFTKVLTKYSTEYNNILFIYTLCQNLELDKKDVVAFFQELRLHFDSADFVQTASRGFSNDTLNAIEEFFEDYGITKLDIRRMYRYLDKNVKKDAVVIYDSEDEDD